MRQFRGKRILPAFFNKAILLIIFFSIVISLTAGNFLYEGSDAELTARGYSANHLAAQVILQGDQILGGYGIDVLYPAQGPVDSSGYLPFQYQCTSAGCFQCLEFILWLYDTRLGYPYKWPGSIWNPYELIGVVQIADQLAYKVETKLISSENAQYLLYKDYSDLNYYPNGSRRPPEVGDILISADGGHAMIVNRVGGDQIEVTQQNNWEIKPDPLPLPLENRQLYFNGYVYSVQNSMGWIHSPHWAALFAQAEPVHAGGDSIQWTRDTQSLTLELSGVYLKIMEADPQSDAPYEITRLLDSSGALKLTSGEYVACALRRLAELLQSESSLQFSNGVNSLSIKIPWLSGILQVTPAGGPQDGASHDFNIPACTWAG
jgi:hypothetical protein